MSEQEQQKRFDFIVDLTSLCKQYGWTIEQMLGVVGLKQKTDNELRFEYANETYSKGTWFQPVGKRKYFESSGKIEELCDRILVLVDNKLKVLYDPTTQTWADINNPNT